MAKQKNSDSDGVIKRHKLLRRISSSSKSSSYLAVDSHNKQFTLTFIENEKIRERAKFIAYASGVEAGEAELEADGEIARYQEQCRRIAERVKGLAHENVAEVLGFGIDQERNQMVVVSEFVPGVDLFYATQGLFPLQMLSVFIRILSGLEYMHQHEFLHLNIKPGKIRVDLDSSPLIVKLTDFGFAMPFHNMDAELSGTPLYMAPEAILNEHDKVDERADLFSFGVTAYYCITRHQPFEHRLRAGNEREVLKSLMKHEDLVSPPSHLNKGVPKEMDGIIMGLLEHKAEKRLFANAREVIQAIESKWPQECKMMPHEMTTTLIEG